MGRLVIRKPWPGLCNFMEIRERFVNAYFKHSRGSYLSGDHAHRDTDGYFWIAGSQ